MTPFSPFFTEIYRDLGSGFGYLFFFNFIIKQSKPDPDLRGVNKSGSSVLIQMANFDVMSLCFVITSA